MKQQKHYLKLVDRHILAITKEFAPELVPNRNKKIDTTQTRLEFPDVSQLVKLNLGPYEMVELAASLHKAGAFWGGASRKDAYSFFETICDKKLINPESILGRIRGRVGSRSIFLDNLKSALNTYAEKLDKKKSLATS